ncbi:MAG: DNA-processing protein DprA [Lachnospiraceae bacterium]|nr:DNA-processing protein DprA [Lachnospiraceae bacterium]
MMYQYWFLHLRGISNAKKHRLIQAFQTAKRIYDAYPGELRDYGLLEEAQIQNIQKHKQEWDLQGEYRKFCATGQSFVTLEMQEYPKLLTRVYDAPYGLYFQGVLPGPDEKMVAIVGARNCSAYGKKMAEDLSKELGRRGYWVVSGMARGIDACAHAGCMEGGGSTVAVLGSGVDVCYPKSNQELYHSIKKHGCVISEYPPGAQPLAKQFPARNRIISGMAQQVIVVEAREKSGSLITIDYALEQGKDVYAVPGRMTDPLSRGCNNLIGQGAGIITSVEQFISNIEEIGFMGLGTEISCKEQYFSLEKEELLVYSCFDFYPKSIELVLAETGLDLLLLLSVIMDLCDKGYLKEIFKNEYIKCK